MNITPNPLTQHLDKRKEALETQKALAGELGVTQSFLSDIFKGKRNFSEKKLAEFGFVNICVPVRVDQAPRVVKAIEKELSK